MPTPNVVIKDYNPDWEIQFEYEKDSILSVVSNKALKIEHIGSTSIKGLGAKPIIDIMVGISNIEETEAMIGPLSTIDYEYVPKPELTDRRFFRKGPWGQGKCHLHICEWNSMEWMNKIKFRDYLRNHPEAALEYYNLKLNLSKDFKFDRQTYTKKKEPFIKEIIERANRKVY